VLYFAGEILPRIRQQRDDFELVLIGKDPPPELLALHHDPNARITVTGLVDDTRPYLQGSAVFICPLRSGSGTRFKLLEALACGCPVVSTRVGAEGLGAVDGQHMLLRDDPQAFADAVLEILDNPALGAQIGQQGREWVIQMHAWAYSAARLREVYGYLIGHEAPTLRMDSQMVAGLRALSETRKIGRRMVSVVAIDDNIAVLNAVKIILETAGFEAQIAPNGMEGMRLIRRQPPDMVICDITMPGMTGHDVLRELRRDPATATIPVIFLTAHSERDDVRMGMELGADDCITKPFSARDILGAISQHQTYHDHGPIQKRPCTCCAKTSPTRCRTTSHTADRSWAMPGCWNWTTRA
jgi:CheY-like chemotaxis protein